MNNVFVRAKLYVFVTQICANSESTQFFNVYFSLIKAVKFSAGTLLTRHVIF